MSSNPFFSLVHASKTYSQSRFSLGPRRDRFEALHDANLGIDKGTTLAILGRNGAGKSTLCKISAGMIRPSSGFALLDGIDVTANISSVSREIGVVLGPTLVYNRLTGYKYLRFFARIYDVPEYEQRITTLAKLLELETRLDSHIESYSMGMKMKISLARALLHDPDFLILDEFTLGLDPISALRIREFIKGLKKTVLLTTHNTLEAGDLASRIAFISKGSITAINTLENLLESQSDDLRLIVEARDLQSLRDALNGADYLVSRGSPTSLEVTLNKKMLPPVLGILSRFEITRLQTLYPTLEDTYSRYTGEVLTQAD